MIRDLDPTPAAQFPIQVRRSVTDSPWFWVLVFSGMAWVALTAMEHKFGRRQSQIERQFQAREHVARHGTGRAPIPVAEPGAGDFDVDYSAPERTIISLWPLRALALVLMTVATVVLVRSRMARPLVPDPEQAATAPDKGSP